MTDKVDELVKEAIIEVFEEFDRKLHGRSLEEYIEQYTEALKRMTEYIEKQEESKEWA